MCFMCNAQYREEHERQSGPLCIGCGAFHLDHESFYEMENRRCYHCFAREAGLDPCPVCGR